MRNIPELRYMSKQLKRLQLIRRQPGGSMVSRSLRTLNPEILSESNGQSNWPQAKSD